MHPFTTTYVTTPFPYAQKPPHIGNLSAALKVDTVCRLRESYHNGQFSSEKTFLPYSFHLTGLPIFQTITRIKALLQEGSTKEEILKIQGLEQLSPYIKNITELTESLSWINVLKEYYTDLFKQVNINTSLPLTHTTTDIDEHYSKFVNWMYTSLKQKDLILEKDHFLICCNSCKNVIGDHDRILKEGIGIEYPECSVSQVELNNNKFFILHTDVLESEGFFFEGFILTEGARKILSKCFGPKEELLVYLEDRTKQINLNLLQKVHLPSSLSYCNKKASLPVTVKNITCRCGGTGIINKQKTLFLKYSCPLWKEEVQKIILGSKNTEEAKAILLSQSKTLRDVSFLRKRGYGTHLDILKDTPYADCIVDSLSDSALHNYYYSSLFGVSQGQLVYQKSENFLDSMMKSKVILHGAGRELLGNHLLYQYYFLSALLPKKQPAYYDCSKFIVVKGNVKMSKSLGNTITWDDLKANNLRGADLRAFLALSSDSIDPIVTDIETITESGRILKKQVERFWAQLKGQTQINGLIYCWVHLLSKKLDLPLDTEEGLEIKKLSQMYYSRYNALSIEDPLKKDIKNFNNCIKSFSEDIEVSKYFGNRDLYHIIFSDILGLLKKSSCETDMDTKSLKMVLNPNIKKLLENLVSVYLQ